MAFKSTPSQLTVAAQVTTGELYVVMPDIEAISAFLGHAPTCFSSILGCQFCFKVAMLAKQGKTHRTSFCVIFSPPGLLPLPPVSGYLSPWPHPLQAARTR